MKAEHEKRPVFPTLGIPGVYTRLQKTSYLAGAVEVTAVLLNTAIQVLKVLLQPHNLILNLLTGTLHHINGQGVVVRIAQNRANVGKTHSGLTAGSNKPCSGDRLLIKNTGSVSITGHSNEPLFFVIAQGVGAHPQLLRYLLNTYHNFNAMGLERV